MRTPILGRILIAVVGLAVVGVPVYLVKNAVTDKVDDTLTAAGFENVPPQPHRHQRRAEPLQGAELRGGLGRAAG